MHMILTKSHFARPHRRGPRRPSDCTFHSTPGATRRVVQTRMVDMTTGIIAHGAEGRVSAHGQDLVAHVPGRHHACATLPRPPPRAHERAALVQRAAHVAHAQTRRRAPHRNAAPKEQTLTSNGARTAAHPPHPHGAAAVVRRSPRTPHRRVPEPYRVQRTTAHAQGKELATSSRERGERRTGGVGDVHAPPPAAHLLSPPLPGRPRPRDARGRAADAVAQATWSGASASTSATPAPNLRSHATARPWLHARIRRGEYADCRLCTGATRYACYTGPTLRGPCMQTMRRRPGVRCVSARVDGLPRCPFDEEWEDWSAGRTDSAPPPSRCPALALPVRPCPQHAMGFAWAL
ncbi:uncharacterized protein TRAVEDRAFT_32643 [Trametes versicolor FP-101664 SS1]|uniref:Uncharacterized protein n=1 Tax=Trametes versicolor (strain FP-101664) TaxID=717944 RepID=R7S611_TRAVS|nr:uncharacterized protein TRAVEDRAFT_32643 [Trametes versicolor FP-101664 SS1]EIW51178.1 hypothetical protein TRAVEDRAFT_32643 [Trametes versicolor FP-101664 SS1]